MSRHELVDAFLEGRISRRTLIRRLVAGGVSAGAAVSYAHVLAPERAAAGFTPGGDHYPLVDLRIKSSKLARVRSREQILVRVATSEEVRLLELRVLLRTSGGGVPIGQRFFASFSTGATAREVTVPINRAFLAGRTSARLYVQDRGSDDENLPALASTAKTLS